MYIEFGKAKSKDREFYAFASVTFSRKEFKIDIEGSICPMVIPFLCKTAIY
jgi:hypothetical protein